MHLIHGNVLLYYYTIISVNTCILIDSLCNVIITDKVIII